MRFTGFVGPTYSLENVTVDCQRCVNLYPEMNELGTGKEGEVGAMVWTPGLSLLATIGSGPIRGMHTASNGTLYVVSNNKAYSVNSAWSATELGTLNTSSGTVSMADNGTSLVIVDGTNGWVVTLSTGAFAEITDADFYDATNQVTFVDNYFVFNRPSSGQFFISDLSSATSYDALDITTAEGHPDNVVGLIANGRDLWIFGEQSTEVYYNSGDTFPFSRIQGAFIEKGCISRHSIQKIDGKVFWLGRDKDGAGIVYAAQGFQPQRVSNHAVEAAIQDYTQSSATAWVYQQDGHSFYCLNFSDADVTWVYDTTTGLWHERCYNNLGIEERARPENHAYAYNTHVVGDYVNGKIYSLSRTTYTDNTVEIRRYRRAPHISSDGKNLFHKSFELDIETGVGLDGSVQGSDPQVMLRWSDDGGRTWSNEKTTSFGSIGSYKQRALFRRLGRARDRVYEAAISDPVKVAIKGAWLDVEQGAA